MLVEGDEGLNTVRPDGIMFQGPEIVRDFSN
jgi:hypothetical protein